MGVVDGKRSGWLGVAQRFADARRGAVSIIAAFSLVGLIGAGALAVDLNQGYDQRMINQRVADMAALGSALAYKVNGSAAVLNPTALDIAQLNGLGDATTVATLVDNYPTTGAKSVKVVVTVAVPLSLAKAMGLRGSYNVGATAYASLSSGSTLAPNCIIALSNSGDAISTVGGATIDAPECAVAAVGNINNGGTRIQGKNIISGSGSISNNYGTITADVLRYATSFNNPSWNGAVPAADKRTNAATTVTDPLAGNAELAAARAQLGTYTAPPAIGNPTTPAGLDWTVGSSPSVAAAPYRSGNSSNYTVPAGDYTIGRLVVDGGINLTFQNGANVTVANGVSIGGGSTVKIGNGNWKINGGFNSGSSGVTFGNGTLQIGSGTVTFAGTNKIGNGNVAIAGDVTIGGGTSLTIGNGAHAFKSLNITGGAWINVGTGDVDVVEGVVVGGGSTFAVGDGNYRLGKNGSGNAIDLSGSAVLIMGDGTFSANGNITTQGGSRLVFGKTTNHYINGNMTIAGSVLFGTSRYTIAGDFTNGTGGTTWPYTSPVTGGTYGNTLEGVSVSGFDMAGVNVTFILGGALNLSGGAKTKLIANTVTVSGGALADILIDSLTSTATNWGAGSQNTFVGTVHLPNSDLTLSGGNNTTSAGQCFMLVANRITANGGATAGTACTGISGNTSGGSGSGTIGLIT